MISKVTRAINLSLLKRFCTFLIVIVHTEKMTRNYGEKKRIISFDVYREGHVSKLRGVLNFAAVFLPLNICDLVNRIYFEISSQTKRQSVIRRDIREKYPRV